MKHSIHFLTTLLLLTLLAACAAPAAGPTSDDAAADADSAMGDDHYPVTITHEEGELTFDAAPERVIVIREELLETLLAVGVQPVGYGGRVDAPEGEAMTDHPYLSQEMLGTPTYIGQATEPSLERMAALNPDLILWPTDGGANSEIYDSIAEIAPTLAYNPGVPGAWKEILPQLGILFNHEEMATKAVAAYKANVETLRGELTDVIAEAPRAVILYLPDPSTTFVLGREFAFGAMIEEIGLDVVAPAGLDLGPSGAAMVDIEALADIDTDTIFTVQFSEGETDHPAEPIIASLGKPIVRGVLDMGRPYAGPFSEQFYQEQFQAGLIDVYGGAVASDDSASDDAMSDAAFPVTVTDTTGHELSFDAPVEKVVCLTTLCIGSMAFIGVSPAAVPDWDFTQTVFDPLFFDQPNDVTLIGTDDFNPDFEEILAFEPDLVFTNGEEDQFAALGEYLPTYTPSWSSATLEDFFFDAHSLAQVHGVEIDGKIESLLARAKAYGAASGRAKTILSVYDNEDGSFWINPNGVYCPYVLPEGSCGMGDDGWAEVTTEGLLEVAPDVILFHGSEEGLAALEDDALWAELGAVQSEAVIFVGPEDALNHGADNPHTLGIWLDTVMPLAYPDVFDGALTDEDVAEILSE